MELEKEIGQKLQHLRKKKGYSLREVGNLLGVSYSYVSQIEGGKKPSLTMIERLAQLYGVKVSALFGNEVEVPKELEDLGVEWVTFANKMEKQNLTPEEIEKYVRIVKELRGE